MANIKIVNQDKATDYTTVDVVVEASEITSGGYYSYTESTPITYTTTEYNLLVRENAANAALFGTTTEVRDLPHGTFPSVSELSDNPYEFTIGKHAGNVYVKGGRRENGGNGFLQRKINGTWTTVKDGSRISGTKEWDLTYTWTGGTTNRLFRVAAYNSEGSKKSVYAGGTYPRTEDVTVPRTGTIYKVDSTTSRREEIRVEPKTEYVNPSTRPVELFNSNVKGFVQIDQIFQTAVSSSPFVDLANYIKQDLGVT